MLRAFSNMKKTFYFSHDYNASQDAKILNLIAEMGLEGYGLYWVLIERLVQANGKLLLEDLKGLAFAIRTDEKKLILLVNKFSLFEKDDTHFWNDRLNDHLKERQKLSNVRAKQGKKGGLAKAKQLLSKSLAKRSKVKESKVKESKVNNIQQAEACEDKTNELLKEFEPINPAINYGDKTQRKALAWLVEKYNVEKVRATIKYLCSIAGKKYAPTITTPYQLKNKLGALIIYKQKEEDNSNTIIV